MESGAQKLGTARMKFDSHNLRTACQKANGDGAGPGADVEDELPLLYSRFSDESSCPSGAELMPPPPLRRATGGHDGPSP